MIGALAGRLPVAEHQVEVEEPALHRGLARLDLGNGPLRERDGREARRAREALLAARVSGIDAPSVEQHRRAAEAGDAVHDGERAVVLGDLRQRRGLALRAGRGLGMYERQHFRIGIRLEGLAYLVRG